MCNTYVGLHIHSYYSLLDGLPSPRKIAERAKEIGSPAIALTDHGNIFGMIDHMAACKKVGIKPICGIELYMCADDPTIKNTTNKKRHHLTLLAKNQEGVRTLMALVSETNRPDFFYHKPRINLERLAAFAKDGNLICLSGCLGGELSTSLFLDEIVIDGKKYTGLDRACRYGKELKQIETAKELLRDGWQDTAAEIIQQYQKIFGKENYYLELQNEGMVAQAVVVESLRQMAKDLNVQTVATLDAHYTCQQDFDDHKLLLCSQMHTTMEEQDRIKAMGGDTMAFFYLDQFHIFTHEEMAKCYSTKEIEASLEIADKIKPSSLTRKPCLPNFKNDAMLEKKTDANDYLAELCVEGAKTKLADLSPENKKVYWDRLQRELRIIKEAKLADYFLIVWDVCCFVDRHNGPRGKGRGSGAGCLVNYLTGITGIDPIEYGLYFERFYNASRNIPPHFDFAHVEFMNWYVENFEQLHAMDVDQARKILVGMAMKTGRTSDKLKKEAKWIDDNNPKMWLYLAEFAHKISSGKNESNSHIAWATGMTDDVDLKKEANIHPGHISLPDIDVDIGVSFRSEVVDYLKSRWGEDYVAQMITFGRLQGKAAIKEVFRVQKDTVQHLMKVKAAKEGKDPNDMIMTAFDVCNEITKHIPDEAMIADDLRQAREENEDPDYGILRWAIDNVEQVRNAYEWYKPLFDQAMRIEGTKKSQSRHAAGIVIADRPIQELVPLTYDAKSKGRVVGFEMSNAEMVGAVKFDFLGIAALDKLWFGQDLVNEVSDDAVLEEDYVE